MYIYDVRNLLHVRKTQRVNISSFTYSTPRKCGRMSRKNPGRIFEGFTSVNDQASNLLTSFPEAQAQVPEESRKLP